MNGITKRPASRLSFSILWMGSCLFGGFALGSKIHNPLKMTQVNFSKVSWLSQAAEIRVAEPNIDKTGTGEIKLELEFTPFKLTPFKLNFGRSERVPIHARKGSSKMGWAQLDIAIRKLRHAALLRPTSPIESRLSEFDQNVFQDYLMTLRELRHDFIASLIPTLKTVSNNQVVSIQRSSAVVKAPQKVIATIKSKDQSSLAPGYVKSKVINNDHLVQPSIPVLYPMEKNNPWVNTQETPYALSPSEKKLLSNALQGEQLKSYGGVMVPAAGNKIGIGPSKNLVTNRTKTPSSADPQVILAKQTPKVMDKNLTNPIQTLAPLDEIGPQEHLFLDPPESVAPNENPVDPTVCDQLRENKYLNSLGNQVCPVGREWLSKDIRGQGWVKVDFETSLPTLHYYPSPNSKSTLLLDTNSLAFLGLKNGIHILKGMGIVVGTLPTGYRVEFKGRAEEPETFEVKGQKYFAILNVEPGSGIVRLVPLQNDKPEARIFSPVLEDTITYLDLTEPKIANFVVKVVKSGKKNDPDVTGLKVGVSAEITVDEKIEGITQTQGRAALREVPMVPGYPVYVDVSSRYKNQNGYTYRFLLNERNQAGDYILRQIEEEKLFQWMRLGHEGMTDQSAMIIGLYNRKYLGGFKEHYSAKAEIKTSKSGVDPSNFSILWDDTLSETEPLEGDIPRFMAARVPEGLTQLKLVKEGGEVVRSQLIPISPGVVHVISE